MRSLVLVAALCAVVTAGCGGGSGDTAAKPAPAPVENTQPTAPTGRERAPAIAGESLDGDPISLSDYRGRPVLINVWSSW